jgi:hypothetical protein
VQKGMAVSLRIMTQKAGRINTREYHVLGDIHFISLDVTDEASGAGNCQNN